MIKHEREMFNKTCMITVEAVYNLVIILYNEPSSLVRTNAEEPK